MNFLAPLVIVHYSNGHLDPFDVLESDPFEALLTRVRINPCFPLPVAREIVRRWNSYLKTVTFLQSLHTESADQVLSDIGGAPGINPPEGRAAPELDDIVQTWPPAFPDALPGPCHETLYRRQGGGFLVELVGHWPGARPRVEEVSAEEAAQWLWRNGHALPENLGRLATDADE
ncbi:MAG TPA: hypothetical protein VGD78_19350 [Chthoniobacterales bacterium]